MRIGQGWDIHRLERGRKLVLGGVELPSETGTVAHSDGDALAHAVIDAIFGAVADGDIGSHFPDNDPEWAGADSLELLTKTVVIAAAKGFRPINIDTTIILQTPKLRPYINEMRINIAKASGLEVSDVSVKAKTNEGLSDLGTGRAVETQAIVLMNNNET